MRKTQAGKKWKIAEAAAFHLIAFRPAGLADPATKLYGRKVGRNSAVQPGRARCATVGNGTRRIQKTSECRLSFLAEGHHGVNLRGAARGNVAGKERGE